MTILKENELELINGGGVGSDAVWGAIGGAYAGAQDCVEFGGAGMALGAIAGAGMGALGAIETDEFRDAIGLNW